MPANAQEGGEYELTGEGPGLLPGDDAASRRRGSASGAEASATPVIPYRRSEPAAAPLADLYFPSRGRDLYLPAVLLAAGMALGFGELVHVEGNAVRAARTATVFFVAQALFLLIAIPLLTRYVSVAFGTLPQAALKFCAIAIVPAALGLGAWIVLNGCSAPIAALVVSFSACWAMFAVLFELDFNESRLCAAVYWVIALAIGGPVLFSSFWLLSWIFHT